MGEAGRLLVEAEFRRERVAETYLALYQAEVLGAR
jgi:hypothetical protein